MIRLAVLVAGALALAGCNDRQHLPGPIDVQSSYTARYTSNPTLPRCYHHGRPQGVAYIAEDIAAVRWLGISTIEQAHVVTCYRHEQNSITIEPWMPRSTLLHEVCHAGQFAGGLSDPWQLEAGAMVCEVATLMSEGWSDERIRELSHNNYQVTDATLTWIRERGPHFIGETTDVLVAYQWGKSTANAAELATFTGAQ